MGKLLGRSVLLAFADALGAGPRIASALGAQTLTRSVEVVSLPVESNEKPHFPLEIVNFINEHGKNLVSLVVAKEEAPPGLHACVANELLKFIVENAPVDEGTFTMFVPAGVPAPKSSVDLTSLAYKFVINDDGFESRDQMFLQLDPAPGSLQAGDEFLASILHLAQVFGICTSFVLIPVRRVNPADKQLILEEKAAAFQTISKVGALIAQWLALGFSNQLMDKDLPDKLITKSSTSAFSGLYA